MYKKRITITILMIICLLTACAKAPDSEERNGVMVAAGGDSYNDNQQSEEETESSPPAVETTEDGLAESPDNPVEEEILAILADCADVKIEQTIDAAGGTTLLIDADVNVDGIERVSQYEYELADITEEKRADLFEAVFSELAGTAVYDELNDVWTLDIDPEIRNYFLYQINYSNGGVTIPGEQIIVLENRYYNLYPFEDNRLASLSDSKVGTALDEAAAICGLVQPDEGRVLVGGKQIGKDVDFPESIGVIIEASGLLPTLSTYKNLDYLASLRGMIGKREIRNAITTVGLDPDDKKHVGKYSLGMKQRLGIAQAIMENPDILILDEPMNALDKNGVAEIRELLLRLKEEGKTILIVSHNSEDIHMLCDTVHEMDGGILS